MDNQTVRCIALRNPLIVVCGPTASGKSLLAQELALHFGGEVVSADSMQVYRGMDIGTGKIDVSEQRVKHWGINLCDPDKTYSVAQFQEYARTCIRNIDDEGKRPILCGGTGLYIEATIDNFQFPKVDQARNEAREYYTAFAEEQGAQALWDLLFKVDSKSAELIHPNNVRRVVRAFEMLDDGMSYAEQRAHSQKPEQIIRSLQIGLQVEPETLRCMIDARVDDMMNRGLVEEVENLLDKGFRESLTSSQAIGYKELVEVFEGRTTLEEAVFLIKQATHRYAKRQRTWFRKDKRIRWIEVADKTKDDLIAEALFLISEFDRSYSNETVCS